MVMPYHLHMPSYFLETFTEYPYLKHKLTEPTSLQLEKINCIIEDHNGTIWLGANGNGLYQLAEENGTQFTFHNYTRKDGLPNNTIIAV